MTYTNINRRDFLRLTTATAGPANPETEVWAYEGAVRGRMPVDFRKLLVALTAVLIGGGAALAQSGTTLTHVHGLAYSADGKRLMMPSLTV